MERGTSPGQMKNQRVLIVSNRLPVTIEKRNGKIRYQHSVGGLATGLKSFYKNYDSIWIGWCGGAVEEYPEAERKNIEEDMLSRHSQYPVFLTQQDIEDYYHGFTNETIWPLFHYFTQYTQYNEDQWMSYRKVTRIFCDAVLRVARPGDIIWIHDYHLMLLPRLIRDEMPEAIISCFLHIPFPSYEIFRLLPWRKEILEGLLGSDLIGFHTYDYTSHFLSSVHRLLGHECTMNNIMTKDRVIRADAFPMGIDYQRFEHTAETSEVQLEVDKIRQDLDGLKVIVSIDRLDYTKGIPKRLEAYDVFLRKYPEYKEKVKLIMIAVPSREQVEQYKRLKRQVNELVGQINGEHGTIGWVPVLCLYRSVSFTQMLALYNAADVFLITPIRDGMNLVAKECIASKRDNQGVLILSEMAGAAKELGEAIIVNPNNQQEIADALREALEMPVEEQIEKNKVMLRRIKRYNVERWAEEFIERLKQVKDNQRQMGAKILTRNILTSMLDSYRKSKKRLLFLDYDGTLVPFYTKPEQAKPTQELLELLSELANDNRNEVVIISGRDKNSLGEWLKDIPVRLVAEHGIWTRDIGSDWTMVQPLRNEWKEEVRPLLELYVDRTPGSFIEEKEYSLVWHYRKVDAEFSLIRARELIDGLLDLAGSHDLQVLEGKKVVEVKNAGISKGSTALNWIMRDSWDFIMAIGDDWTDEGLYSVMPDGSYSIKVGFAPSKAKYNVESYKNVLSVLQQLTGE